MVYKDLSFYCLVNFFELIFSEVLECIKCLLEGKKYRNILIKMFYVKL